MISSPIKDTEKLERLTKRERIGELLVRFLYVKLNELIDLMTEYKDKKAPFGEFLLEKKVISYAQLKKVLDFQKNQDSVIDGCLDSLGLMTNSKKWDILTRLDKVGEILVRERVISLSDLITCMEEQEKNAPEKLLGDILVEKCIVTKKELKKALEIQKNTAMKVMSCVEEITNLSQLQIKFKINHTNLLWTGSGFY